MAGSRWLYVKAQEILEMSESRVLLSGEKGGPFASANGGKQNPLCLDKGKHADVQGSFSQIGSLIV